MRYNGTGYWDRKGGLNNERDDYIGNVSGVYRMGNIGGNGTHSGGIEHGNSNTFWTDYSVGADRTLERLRRESR